MTKKCNVCKQTKKITEFNVRTENKTKPKYRCKQCDNDYIIKYNHKNNKKVLSSRRKRKNEIKKWFNEELKKDIPCKDCNNIFPPYCMDFDHLDGTEKTYSLAKLVGEGYSKERILEEIKKCDLVCANCHRIRTHNRGWNLWENCKKKYSDIE